MRTREEFYLSSASTPRLLLNREPLAEDEALKMAGEFARANRGIRMTILQVVRSVVEPLPPLV